MTDIAIVSGGFDPIHDGHLALLKEAHENYDAVIVLLNSDEWLRRKKGKEFMSFELRKEILEAIKYVDEVLSVDDSDNTVNSGLELLRASHPKDELYFLNGGDRLPQNTPEESMCNALDINMDWGIGGLKINSSSELLTHHFHKLVTRKWGLWTIVKQISANVKVKELIVYPSMSLSYQRHFHRSESWFVAKGNGGEVLLEGQKYKLPLYSTFEIPVNSWHQLINNSITENLHIIETQFGDKCDELDIERKDID